MTIVCASAVAFGLVGAASSGAKIGDQHGTSKACVAEKKADKGAFKALYGDHAMRDCKEGRAGLEPTVSEFKNAAKECKAEREADAEAFQTYGSNYGGRVLLGKCVSSHVKHSDDEDEGEDDGGDTEDPA